MKYKMVVNVDTYISWEAPHEMTTYIHKLYEERYFLGFIKNWCKVYTSTYTEEKSIGEIVAEYNEPKEKYIPTYPKTDYYEDLR